MFTSLFNLKQKKVFLKIAEDILSIDGEVDNDEEAYLLQLCNELSLLPEDRIPYNLTDLNDIFNTKETQKVLYIESLLLAFSNSEFHEKENEFISNIFDSLNYIDSKSLLFKEGIRKLTELQEKLLKYIIEE